MSQDVVVAVDKDKVPEKCTLETNASQPQELSTLTYPTKYDEVEKQRPVTTTDSNVTTAINPMVLSKTEVPVANGINGTCPFPPPSSVNPLEPVPRFLRIVEGIDKLRRAIGKELISPTSNEKCSNLPHLLSIAQILLRHSEGTHLRSGDFENQIPSAVLKPFHYVPKKTKKRTRFIVDIVSADGAEWSKISARNPRSLSLLASGGGGFGQKSMIDHAKDYIQCAQQHQRFFKPPQINFIFASGIGNGLAVKLESLGIKVEGERIADEELAIHPRLKPYKDLLIESDSNSEKSTELSEDSVDGHCSEDGFKIKEVDKSTHNQNHVESSSCLKTTSLIRNSRLEGIMKLNLDITALLAYCSNLTNGHTNVSFKSQILTQQLEMEKLRPQKPVLESIFKGRELYCCEMAYKEFKTILQTVGGLQEQRRAAEFLKQIQVVPDQISERSRTLAVIGSIKLRSVTIFGTGDSIQAVTVTANSGFVRSATAQGIDFPVFLHESRALTEDKENLNSFFASLKFNC